MPARLLQRPCPVCASPVHTPLFNKHGLQLVRCNRCSMVYVNPVEEDWADGSRYDQLGTPFYLSPDKLQSDYNPVRFSREIRLFRRFVPQGRVLDVGCSTGAFLFHLQTRFPSQYQATGIDVSGPALDHAESQGVRVLRTSFLETDFGPPPFDAITFWAVAEHLMDPGQFLRHAMGLLRPGGRCFVLVPNFRSLAVRLLGQRYRYIFPQHLNYFTAGTLGQFAATLPATRVLHTTSMHFNPIVIVQDARSDGGFVADEERARLLRKTTGYKNNPLLTPVRHAIAGVEALLGTCGLADNTVLVLERR